MTVLVVEVDAADDTSDPEDLGASQRSRPLTAFERQSSEVGGRAESVFANAVLGMFGAPRAHDDDPVRAVRAALGRSSRRI